MMQLGTYAADNYNVAALHRCFVSSSSCDFGAWLVGTAGGVAALLGKAAKGT